jgi:hypothetical protein
MKTILILAMSLAMTGAALAKRPRWPIGSAQTWYLMDLRHHGYVMRHQKRLYGATSGPREITTDTTTRHHRTMASTRQRNIQPSNNGL